MVVGFACASISEATVQVKTKTFSIATFTDEDSIDGHKSTHEASVALVENARDGGGKFAAKIVVDSDAGATDFFGTGFRIPSVDLSNTREIRFWIKTDVEGRFGFEIHCGDGNNASVARFTTVGSKGNWKQVKAPVASFNQPGWAQDAANLSEISFIQVTAFGSGPYDGKYVILGDVTGGPLSANSETHKATKNQNISLSKIDGRHWLVGADGNPFFAHGITHVSNARSKYDFMEISTACRKLGFNAYGYGCPPELRADMPYLESWNHLVPISMYRDKAGHKFVDIFDPGEQARIEAGVKANCEKSKDDPNCIGYCWTDLATWPLKNQTEKNWVNFIRGLPDVWR